MRNPWPQIDSITGTMVVKEEAKYDKNSICEKMNERKSSKELVKIQRGYFADDYPTCLFIPTALWPVFTLGGWLLGNPMTQHSSSWTNQLSEWWFMSNQYSSFSTNASLASLCLFKPNSFLFLVICPFFPPFFNFIAEDVTLETVQIDWVYTVNY